MSKTKTPYIPATELKTILHSKRANLYYLEHCRVLVNGGRVEYVTDQGKESLYWNIPIANTTCILLGSGTSITQAAVRDLAKAGVMIGFCGGGGTPLFAGSESEVACEFFSPQSEYRPTEYLQAWVRFWFDDALRLRAAKALHPANRFLDHGNYLAYGLGATATWVLGLPHGLAVLHGKTRRGGLVFDVADLIKDALILPQAFVSAMRGDSEQEFRERCVETLVQAEALDYMIDTLKAIATETGKHAA